jgi:hypothetical protein
MVRAFETTVCKWLRMKGRIGKKMIFRTKMYHFDLRF